VQDGGRFRTLCDEWQSLYAACPELTPFNSWEWLFSWWQSYASAKALRILVWRNGIETVAILPLYIELERTALGTPCQVFRLLGDGSGDSDYLAPLIRADCRDAVLKSFGDWLAQYSDWNVVQIRDLAPDSPVAEEIRRESGRLRCRFRLDHGRSAAVHLPPSFAEFLSARASRFRTKVRALLRRLDGGDLVFEDEPLHELRRRLRSLFELHQRRWQSTGEPGVFGDKRKRLFYARFVTRFCRRGWLRLYSLRIGDRYVAHQLCFADRGTTYLLQEGFDLSEPAASYGQMLRAAVIRSLIGRNEGTYDFLGGFSRHKEDWGARQSNTTHVVMARRSWRGSLYFYWPLFRQQGALAVKRVLPAKALDSLRRMAATFGRNQIACRK
jgi:CelD/BcsL family acetyltransferase involved in cellulose biosynthesis